MKNITDLNEILEKQNIIDSALKEMANDEELSLSERKLYKILLEENKMLSKKKTRTKK